MKSVWLITGTRKLDEAGRRLVVDTLTRERTAHGYPDLVIHGDCKGVDRFVAGLCQQLDIKLLAMPADWEGWRAKGQVKKAGPERNKAMVKAALGLEEEGWAVRYLAFPRGESVGTRGCIALCEGVGFPGVITELPL